MPPKQLPPVRRWVVEHLHRDTGELVSRVVEGTVSEHAAEIAGKTVPEPLHLNWEPTKPVIFTYPLPDNFEVQVRELESRPQTLLPQS